MNLSYIILKEYIQTYIKNELNESAVGLDDLSNSFLIKKLVPDHQNATALILVHENQFKQYMFDHLESINKRKDIKYPDVLKKFPNIILGYIEYGKNRVEGEAYGAKEVYFSAAIKGYGPLMYDLALSDAGKLMSDRDLVSSSAEKVWKYYFSKRKDVKHLKLDDIENPRTPTKYDDCKLQRDIEGAKSLNYVYQFKTDNINTNSLLEIGKQKTSEISKYFKFPTNKIELLILRLAQSYFFMKYEL